MVLKEDENQYQRLIHTGRVFDLYSENISTDDGVSLDLDVIRHPGAAAIVPIQARRNRFTAESVPACRGGTD